MRNETVRTDITVVGGGLAGVCAAIAAARLGCTVALVNNRPVLGGNSSSEVRVWVCGATAHGTNRYARETGIMGELFVENQYRNPEGNPYLWDLTVLEAVKAEPNIRLFLNTDVHEVEAGGDAGRRTITAVTGWMMGSERRIRFESAVFLDCTGDGLVGFLAGAKYRLGREARSEYGESWAPEVADDITLGSTLLFYTKDTGQPVKYVPPCFAKDIAKTSIPMKRVIRSGDNGCHYWWIEWGGELDTVHDNERIRDELWSVIYGIWDYIKNSGAFPDAANMTLEWVGSMPGKREYRRFVGDYVLNQNDIIAQREFEDRIAFGGWSIDLHPPQGMYSTESGSKHLHADGIYHIPFRSLYSVNVDNLMFAGRDISASHVAFGTTRVMATCAVIGEAAGTGAALAVQHSATPREIAERRLEELQQTLLRQDASIIGLRNRDSSDLARTATASASGTLCWLAVEQAANPFPLNVDVGLLLPAVPELQRLELLVDAASDTTLEVEVWSTGRAENYVPHRLEVRGSAPVAAGERQWIGVDVPWRPAADSAARNAFVVVKANESVTLHVSGRPQTGVLSFVKGKRPLVSQSLEDHDIEQPVVQWSMRQLVRRPFCFRAHPETEAFAPGKAVDGYARPYGEPHLWASEPLASGQEAYLELSWADGPVLIREVQLIFNDDVNEDLINLHHHRTPFDIIPELVRDYRIEAESGGVWHTLLRETDNRKRRRVHRLEQQVHASKLRIVVERTNGGDCAEIVQVRVY
ncbi:pyridine nucleotide-disulfide oxidoreductase [Gordoniibacillus kamchatkensis]|uniref:Pyridine nucleotide-disulfide oxidoreductase n=1 Tax=Gordoniibacillus kamchatkensis TaxID=1590651 RepID=A0ABR5AN20_9BACL|nr:FAD-dependent oxidoreductase [Paenibacillus sp. VKM B-2647]KIL42367.1 pyridine nucleotide-disulfide oxidoreductase [Paenibacillus sp. VKM B-2647]